MHRAPEGLLAQRGYFGSFVPLPARQASPTLGPKGSQDVPRGLKTCRFGTQLRWLVPQGQRTPKTNTGWSKCRFPEQLRVISDYALLHFDCFSDNAGHTIYY